MTKKNDPRCRLDVHALLMIGDFDGRSQNRVDKDVFKTLVSGKKQVQN